MIEIRFYGCVLSRLRHPVSSFERQVSSSNRLRRSDRQRAAQLLEDRLIGQVPAEEFVAAVAETGQVQVQASHAVVADLHFR